MSVPTERADALVDASRLIAASRSAGEIIALASDALCSVAGAVRVQFVDPTVPPSPPMPGLCAREVRGHGRLLGRFELVFAPDSVATPEMEEHIALLVMVAGTALALAGSTRALTTPGSDRRNPPRGDRRKMDRDFIDHTRNGQVGFIVLQLHFADDEEERPVDGVVNDGAATGDHRVLAAATIVDEAIRANDVTYVSGPRELSILLPGATRPESAMAADRIRAHLLCAWASARDTSPVQLVGGVSSGRFEDPQRLAERALDALDEARSIGTNAIVTELGA